MKQGIDGQSDQSRTEKNTASTALSEFANAAAYSAAEEPLRGAAQVVDNLFSTKLDSSVKREFGAIGVSQPDAVKFGSTDWYAQQLGNCGMIVPFMMLRGVVGKEAGLGEALVENGAANKAERLASLAAEAKLAGVTGLVDGFIFRPTDSSASGQDFWGQRAKSAIGEGTSFTLLGLTLPGMKGAFESGAAGLERASLNSALKNTIQEGLRSPLTQGLVSGIPVGIANAEVGAWRQGKPFASREELEQSMVAAGFTGAAFGTAQRVVDRPGAGANAGSDGALHAQISDLLKQGMKSKDLEALLTDSKRKNLTLEMIRNGAKPEQLRTVEVDAYGELKRMFGAGSSEFQRLAKLPDQGISLCWDVLMPIKKYPDVAASTISRLVEGEADARRFKAGKLKLSLKEAQDEIDRSKDIVLQTQAKESLVGLFQNDQVLSDRLNELSKGGANLVDVKKWIEVYDSDKHKAIVERLLRNGAPAETFNLNGLWKAKDNDRAERFAAKAAEARSLAPAGKSDLEVLRDSGIELTPLEKLSLPVEQLTKLPDGKFVPSEMQWRQIMAMDKGSAVRIQYEQKVESGESPALTDIEPQQIKQLRELRKQWSLDGDDKNAVATISARDLDEHLKLLRAQDDVQKEGYGLNIGAGAWQLEARQMADRGYKSRAISLDKRIGLPLQVDLQDVLAPDKSMIPGVYMSPEELRVYGRIHRDPLTLAGDATNLPVQSGSMKWVWGLFSVPFYLDDASSVRTSLSEANRVLEPGGYGRFYPVRADQIGDIKTWFQSIGVEPQIEHTGYYGFGTYHRPKGYLLTWQKPAAS